MNTRRKMMKASPEVTSCNWHLMHEPYHAIFQEIYRENIEYWYNLCANGRQRNEFREICGEIFKMKVPQTGDAGAPAVANHNSTSNNNNISGNGNNGVTVEEPSLENGFYNTKYTENFNKQEAQILIANYGRILTDLGREKAYLFLLLDCRNDSRRKQKFRSVFCGAQSIIMSHESVMHKDFTLPWEEEPKEKEAIVRRAERERRKLLSEEYKANEKVVTSAGVAAPRSLFMSKDELTGAADKKEKLYKHDPAPEPVDRTHFLNSVDWTSLKARSAMQERQKKSNVNTFAGSANVLGSAGVADASGEGEAGTGEVPSRHDLRKRPSAIVDERLAGSRQRTTKPKNQFDGMQVTILESLGYDMTKWTVEDAINELKVRHGMPITTSTSSSALGTAENSRRTTNANNNNNKGSEGEGAAVAGRGKPAEYRPPRNFNPSTLPKANQAVARGTGTYYLDNDGSTVYVASTKASKGGTGGKTENNSNKNNFLAEVSSDPMSHWTNKVLD